MEKNHDLAETLGELHETIAWAIIILAALHAVMALAHHCIWKDGVLARMLPGLVRR